MGATKRNRLFIVRNLALVLSVLSIIALVLYVVPVPEVGEPVTSIALPDSRFVEVDGVLVHYVDHGGGDVLFVLLHGFGASVFTWCELIPELSRMGSILEGYKYPLRPRNWDKGLYWLMEYREYLDIRDDLSEIKAPVLIIHGVNDEIIPLSSSIELYELLITHTFTDMVIINECGHFPHEEKQNLVLDVVKKFLKNTVNNG
ncbi:MAG: hypothetical protein QW123_05285 [Desulfurococcaceae archaeon]